MNVKSTSFACCLDTDTRDCQFLIWATSWYSWKTIIGSPTIYSSLTGNWTHDLQQSRQGSTTKPPSRQIIINQYQSICESLPCTFGMLLDWNESHPEFVPLVFFSALRIFFSLWQISSALNPENSTKSSSANNSSAQIWRLDFVNCKKPVLVKQSYTLEWHLSFKNSN